VGEELSFKDKIRTLHFGTGKARQPRVKETRDPVDGHRIKVTKDEATTRGNLTVEHAKGDRQDVVIRPDIVTREG
jgi:hypothetical protein